MDEHKATADGLCRVKTNTAHSSLKGEWRDDLLPGRREVKVVQPVISEIPTHPTELSFDDPPSYDDLMQALGKLKRGKAGGETGILPMNGGGVASTTVALWASANTSNGENTLHQDS